MKWVYDDGGRAEAGYKGTTGDCVCRAIAIAAELPYQEVYDLINKFGKEERTSKRRRGKSSARTGVYGQTTRKILDSLGWEFIPTMGIGTGCKVHLRAEELPKGRIIAKVSHHCVAVIDGVVHDTYDCTRLENRCVYGYYRRKEVKSVKEERMRLVIRGVTEKELVWLADFLQNEAATGADGSWQIADSLIKKIRVYGTNKEIAKCLKKEEE